METVEFHLEKFSRLLAFLLIILYLGSLSTLFLLPIHFVFKMGIFTIGIYFLQKNWKLHVSRKTMQAVVRVWQDSRGRWGFETRQGRTYKAILLPDSYRTGFISILRFRTLTKVYNVIVPYDSLKETEYCLLTTHLLFF